VIMGQIDYTNGEKSPVVVLRVNTVDGSQVAIDGSGSVRVKADNSDITNRTLYYMPLKEYHAGDKRPREEEEKEKEKEASDVPPVDPSPSNSSLWDLTMKPKTKPSSKVKRISGPARMPPFVINRLYRATHKSHNKRAREDLVYRVVRGDGESGLVLKRGSYRYPIEKGSTCVSFEFSHVTYNVYSCDTVKK
jgi:hypothetical protein